VHDREGRGASPLGRDTVVAAQAFERHRSTAAMPSAQTVCGGSGAWRDSPGWRFSPPSAAMATPAGFASLDRGSRSEPEVQW